MDVSTIVVAAAVAYIYFRKRMDPQAGHRSSSTFSWRDGRVPPNTAPLFEANRYAGQAELIRATSTFTDMRGPSWH